MSKNLVFFTAHFRYPADFGGQRSRFMHEAALVSGSFSSVLSITADVDSLSGMKVDQSNDKNFNLIRLKSNPFRRGKLSFSRLLNQLQFSLRALKFVFNKNSIFFLNNNPIAAYLIIGFALAFLKRDYYLDIRDYPLHIVYKRFRYISFPIYLVDNFIIRNRKGSISVSTGLKSSILLDEKNDAVIPLGFDGDKNHPIRVHKSIFESDICYVGSLNSYFSLEIFLNFLLENNFRGTFHYYGNSDVSRYSTIPFFVNHGSFSKSELVSHIFQYDYGLFPNGNKIFTKYLLGNKFFDYLFSGCGIISFGPLDSDVSVEVSKNKLGYVVDSENFLINDHRSSSPSIDIYSRSYVDNQLIMFFKSIL